MNVLQSEADKLDFDDIVRRELEEQRQMIERPLSRAMSRWLAWQGPTPNKAGSFAAIITVKATMIRNVTIYIRNYAQPIGKLDGPRRLGRRPSKSATWQKSIMLQWPPELGNIYQQRTG